MILKQRKPVEDHTPSGTQAFPYNAKFHTYLKMKFTV